MKKLIGGQNDLETWCKQNNHEYLLAEWNHEKNNRLKPSEISFGSGKIVWWKCQNGHEWQIRIADRAINNRGCPYCSGRYAIKGVNDLQTLYPVIAAEWHPTKNGDLKPTDVKSQSNYKIWWKGECGHEWEAKIAERVKGKTSCPFCSNRKVLTGFNDLSTTNPELCKEWDYDRNGTLKPSEIVSTSSIRVWWKCQYGHEWEIAVRNRTSQKTNCPFCSGRNAIKGVNDLQTLYPEIAKEWNYEMNGNTQPTDVKSGSGKKVWWKCSKCGNNWQAVIVSRTQLNTSCPVCANRQIIQGLNDLATTNPELAREWNYNKNGDIKPNSIGANSTQKVWWKCQYNHEWIVSPNSRTSQKSSCPYCSNKRVLPGFNDLATTHPELCAEWDYEKNGDLSPANVTYGNTQKVWWNGKCGHRWQARIYNRSKGVGCPYCAGQLALQGINDLQTLRPDIAQEWHPTKNGKLMPNAVTCGSNKKVWWICSSGHEWQAVIGHRSFKNCGCPICGNKKVLIGFNDLATTHPELCKDWDYNKNGNLKPTDVTYGSTRKIWWKCQYGHEWQATLNSRSRGRGCPKCSGNGTSLPEQGIAYYLEQICKVEQRIKINKQEVDIYLPEYKIGIEYDGRYYHKSSNIDKEKNKDRILFSTGITVIRIKESDSNITNNNLICYKTDDMRSNYEWAIKQLCGLLSIFTGNNLFRTVTVDVQKDLINIRERFNLYNSDRSLLLVYPKLAKEWDYDKNGDLKPDMFPIGSHMKVWWKCSEGHEWEAAVKTRVKGIGCPCCAGQRAITGTNDLQTLYPEIAAEWHPTKNGELKPTEIMSQSNKKVWWLGKCGHEWQTMVIGRTRNKTGCPFCSNQKVLQGFNDLVTTYPEIAKEWHPIKNGELTPNEVVFGSNKKAWWLCSNGHEWQSPVLQRTMNNNVCPYCSNQKVLQGFNDLTTTYLDIAREWHPTKNGELKPTEITAHSSKKAWWMCSKGHEWEDRINHRTSRNTSCPYCSGTKKRVINIDTGLEFNSISEAARFYGMKSSTALCQCCKGILQTAGGYRWRYLE